MSANQSQLNAQFFGANLFSINDSLEQTCIINELAQLSTAFPLWVGLNDLLSEGVFIWYDVSSNAFSNWTAGEPNNANGNENCVHLLPNGEWSDKHCDTVYSASVIEVNMCPKTIVSASKNKICEGESAIIETKTSFGSEPYSYLWLINSDTIPDSLATIVVSPQSTSTYTVFCKDRYGCQSSASIVLQVDPRPEVNFSVSVDCSNGNVSFTDLTTISYGTMISWAWDLGNGLDTTYLQNVDHNFSNGDYLISLKVESDNNCVGSLSKNINVTPYPIASFNSESSICVFDTVHFLDTSQPPLGYSIAEWEWDLGDSHTRTLQNFNYTYSDSGKYNVQLIVTLDNECKDTIDKQIEIMPVPLSDIDVNNTAGCAPFCPTFNIVPLNNEIVSTIHWIIFNDTIVNPTATYCFNRIGLNDISAIIMSDKGCKDTVTKANIVNVYASPISQFSISPGGTHILDPFISCNDLSIDATKWFWDFGDNEVSDQQSPTHIFRDTGTFTIKQIVENKTGCKDSSFLDVAILPRHLFYIPNAFTPNDDLQNDRFMPKGLEAEYLFYSFTVYDKWGIKLFYTENIYDGWNGKTSDGNNVPQGVYNYNIVVMQKSQKHDYIYEGEVELIR